MVNASHPYQLMVRDKNLVEIAFPNIQLPDSNRNEPLSHGFVQISIKPFAGLPVEEEIRNFAAIFFDYNDPIITDDALTTIKIITASRPNRNSTPISLFPNPASNVINVAWEQDMEGRWQMLDMNGRLILQGAIPSGDRGMRIPVAGLQPGVYVLSFFTSGEYPLPGW